MTTDFLAKAQGVAASLPFAVDVDELVNARGLTPDGRTSANGTCRLLAAGEGWVAVNLARPSDVEALPAVLEVAVESADPWPAIEGFASARPAVEVADRCQLLGVAAAVLGDSEVDAARAVVAHELGGRRREARVVVNLSSLWAGPLCAHLLGRAGMHVIDVESTSRPGRSLYTGDERVQIDFESRQLRDVIAKADVVIESSRPRALAQLGIDAAEFAGEGCTWVSITGYGRASNKVAFGDDAAAAGGLVGYDAEGAPVFLGDAIADPMSGLTAAVAALRWGGGHLVEVVMSAVAKSLASNTC